MIWVFLFHARKFRVSLLRVKGEPRTKSMTGDGNVTQQGTAIGSVMAWLSITRWASLMGLLSLART